MFDDFMTQELKLTKKNSSIIEGIKANVQNMIFINDIKIPIEEGDIFEYNLPSGIHQKLLVTKVTLYNIGSSLDHYEIEYIKD